MERVYTDYTAQDHIIILNKATAGGISTMTVQNLRLVFNETQKDSEGDSIDPLVSTGLKENVSSIVFDNSSDSVVITLISDVPSIQPTDKLTIKVDMGEFGGGGSGSTATIQDVIDIDNEILTPYIPIN